MKWETVTELDRNKRVRSVTHVARAGILRVVLHRLHGLDGWFLSVHPGLVRARELHTGVGRDAMGMAEEHVRSLLTEALTACDAKDDAS